MTDAAQERVETYPDDVHPIRIPKGHKVEIQEQQGNGLIRGTRVSMEELDRLRARQREETDPIRPNTTAHEILQRVRFMQNRIDELEADATPDTEEDDGDAT